MRSVFALMRRVGRQRPQTIEASSPEHPDVIPDPHAAEPGVMRRPETPENVLSRRDSAKTQALEGFTPLPRCPRCGTAIGHSQMECHGCGMETGWL